MSEFAVEFDKVAFYRQGRCIYENLSCRIPRGKITAILGPSGTGKTTMLHLIGRLIKAKSGQINVLNNRLDRLKKNEMLALRQRMGVLFQSGALFSHLSVYDNVAFPVRQNSDLCEELIHTLVMMKLEAVGLRGAHRLMPAELSGGMARRVALARAIALDPEILMYDEPFTGQDPISLKVILDLIKTLNDTLGLTSIIVSHDIEEVLSIADHVIVVADRRLAIEGSSAEVYNSKDPFIHQFLHGDSDGPIAFHYPCESMHTMLSNGERR
ncbi:MAG: ABC transporter ATP-binding protein [Francisellaceae bacterium]